uniref:hepatic lectin-like isoform X1 n=2 Tax=Pristiophorus japonicus TaxID=55135 RepID=UPI00398EC91E
MAGEEGFERFAVDSQQNEHRSKWIPASRFKSFFCGPGLMLLLFILLGIVLILLITGVNKSSETNKVVEEFQSQVQMQVSQALVNVSEKSELMNLERRIVSEVKQMATKLLAVLSKKTIEIIAKISRKVEMLPEPACQNLQCPRYWQHFNGSCYYFSNKEVTWNSSNLYCSLRGSHLVVINDRNEQYFLTIESNTKRYWIGLTDHVNEDNWQWVDGTAYETTPTFWADGEPNNIGNQGEDCVHTDDKGQWNDNVCTMKYPWICEQQAKSA